MATGPGYPSSTNVFVPNHDASGRLTTGFSRNADKFHLPKYVQYVNSSETVGLFMRLSNQEAARVVTTQEYRWPDGAPRPTHANGLEQFNMVTYYTERYDYGFTLGWLTKNQATWPVVEQNAQIHTAKAMTARTIRLLATATTTANWTIAGSGDFDLAQDHTDTAANFVGGFLDQGTSTAPYIKKFLDKVSVLINEETLGVVESDQLQVVINPNTARLWAESSEVHEYVKGSYWAKEELIQGLKPNNKFGLPSSLYGYPILVENCVRTTSRKGATLARTFAMPDQTVLVTARVGELDGLYGAPSFSTLTIFMYDGDFKLETFDDPKNRLTEVHVGENVSEQVTCPLSGYLLTAATSVAS